MLSVKNSGGGGEILVGIRITTPPTKVLYKAGETLDLTGMVVKSVLSDGDTETLTTVTDWTSSPAQGSTLQEANTSVTISWINEGKTYTTVQAIQIEVLSSLAITAPTKVSYYKGDALDMSGCVATATYSLGSTATVTPTFSPADGSTLSSFGTVPVTASYTENGITKTATTNVSVSVKTVTWAGGTDQEIADMVSTADAGVISLADYWTVGDERTVALTAMAQTVSGLSETHAAQNIVLVLMNAGGKTLTAGGTCNFIVGQKNVLGYSNGTFESGVMNSSGSNTGGWSSCPRRTWCNGIYKNAFPSVLQGIFKQFQNVSGVGGGASSGTQTTDDYFALPAEKEVFGSVSDSFSDEASTLTQFSYYKTGANIIKYSASGTAEYWWERSPQSGDSTIFCLVSGSGTADVDSADIAYGFAPFGCI
jgi:hypothetical protein